MAPDAGPPAGPSQQQPPRGLRLMHTLPGPGVAIKHQSWSPDGRFFTSTAYSTLRVWNTDGWTLCHQSSDDVASWSPDRQSLAAVDGHTLHVYDTNTWQLRYPPIPHVAGCEVVAWSPTGDLIAVFGFDVPVEIREAQTGQLRLALDPRTLKSQSKLVDSVRAGAWSPDGQALAANGVDCTVWLWDIPAGNARVALTGTANIVLCVAWSPDGTMVAAGSADRTLRLWSARTGQQIAVLEGHTANIHSIAFDREGRLLASKAQDGTVLLWRCDRLETVAILQDGTEPTMSWSTGLAFHPTEPLLATPGFGDTGIRIWSLDVPMLLGTQPPAEPVHYTNAKVVLVGDSGVGKSGLALVLKGEPFVATESSHGRHVWPLEETQVDTADGRRETRETLLWDLAGQPGYRVFHRQHLDEVSVGVVLFDSRSEVDPFRGVGFWARALDEATRGFPSVKLLVASRVDRGGPAASRQRVDDVVTRYGFHPRVFEVSAKRGDGVAELREAICSAIAWDALPRVSTPRLFYDMKALILDEKASGRVLQRGHELLGRYTSSRPGAPAPEDAFDTCLGRLEAAGFVKRLTFGNLVLLQPEMLDDYGAWLATAARQEPDGLGFIADRRARTGDFAMDAERPLKGRPEERLLITATVEDIVGRGIALPQPTEAGEMLIFPSELREDMPGFPGDYVRTVTFFFDGPVSTIYATLAVCLTHAPAYTRERFFKNAAILRSASDEACGFVIDYPDPTTESRGQLTVFFDAAASRGTKLTFLRYVNRHLERMAFEGTVRRERVYYCGCGYPDPVSQTAVEWRRSRKESTIVAGCGHHLPIDDLAEESGRVDVFVEEQMRRSDEERLRQQRLAVLAEREQGDEFHVFLCHNSKDRPLVRQLAASLREQGVLPWVDEHGVLAGQQFVPELEAVVDRVPSVAIVVGPHWLGRWQKQEYYAFLQRFIEHRDAGAAKRRVKLIPVLLPGAPAEPDMPVFLRGFQYVDLRAGLDRPQTLRALVTAILSDA